MLATAALGSLFLVLKAYEWYDDYREHLTPFLHRPYALADDPPTKLFVDLYFVTTGLHGLHLLTGVMIVLGMARHGEPARLPAAPPEPDRDPTASTGTSST